MFYNNLNFLSFSVFASQEGIKNIMAVLKSFIGNKSIHSQRSTLKEEQSVVNMFRDSPWPGNVLSNFADTPFSIDGVYCSCSESFIQSLKISDSSEQEGFCGLQGEEAWKKGSKLTEGVFISERVWWRGTPYTLHSQEHFDLVKRGLSEKFCQSEKAREALLATGDSALTHDYGQPLGKKQSLPVDTFCQIVTEIRTEYEGKKNA